MLIKHVRVGEKRKPVATVVAISPEAIGVAYCGPKDHFNKKRGVEIAMGRALVGSKVEAPQMKINIGQFRVPLSELIKTEVDFMKKRAKRYYK